MDVSQANGPFWLVVFAWFAREAFPQIMLLLQATPGRLRKDIDELKVEVEFMKSEVVKWRSQFYLVFDAFVRNDRTVLERLLKEERGTDV